MKHVESHGLWRLLLIIMLIPVGLIAFWPSPVDAPVQGQLAGILKVFHMQGIPTWFNYYFVEASANVALFIPLGIVATHSFAEKRWWQISVLGLIASGCMELGQLLFIHNRFASILDLVTNTGGATIGALLAAGALKRLQVRRLSAEGL